MWIIWTFACHAIARCSIDTTDLAMRRNSPTGTGELRPLQTLTQGIAIISAGRWIWRVRLVKATKALVLQHTCICKSHDSSLAMNIIIIIILQFGTNQQFGVSEKPQGPQPPAACRARALWPPRPRARLDRANTVRRCGPGTWRQ